MIGFFKTRSLSHSLMDPVIIDSYWSSVVGMNSGETGSFTAAVRIQAYPGRAYVPDSELYFHQEISACPPKLKPHKPKASF